MLANDMRSYGQYCALARGLDTIGDRWVLLIVRELLEGPRRYGELLDGLPGIATNLLSQRLRDLERDGVVTRTSDGAYTLTEWGRGLKDVVYALGGWAARLMVRPPGQDAVRGHWLTHPINVLFAGVDKNRPRLAIEVNLVGTAVTIVSAAGRVNVFPGRPVNPDVVISGPVEGILGLLAGRLDANAAAERGVELQGDVRRLMKLRPRQPVS